jgi:hypothetical protein
MWGEFEGEFRQKVSMLPAMFVLAVVLIVADSAGVIHLSDADAAGRARRPGGIQHRSALPSRVARADIPSRYLTLYRKAGARYRVPWSVLAGIGKVESDHGRSSAPGVRSGVNRFGCCAGPMQFNLRNGPPSTWDRYGHGSPYDPAQAIPAAARLLRANDARRDVDKAIYSYNHSWAYVARVKALARRYARR